MVDVNVFEKIVKEYFELHGYFLVENISYGRSNEADLLGIHPKNKKDKFIHVEVTEGVPTPTNLLNSIKKKFKNKFIKDVYSKHFNTTDVKKIYVLWWYKKMKKWKNRKRWQQDNKITDIELLSFEDVFNFLEEK